MKSDFEEQLQLVKQLGFNAVREIPIDLTNIVADKEYNLAGNFFYIKDAESTTAYIEVKINSSGANPIRWTKQTGFVHPFNRLYITTPTGQTGTMNILIAAEAPNLFEVVDHRSAVSDSIEGILVVLNDLLNEFQGKETPGIDGTEKTVGVAAGEILPWNPIIHRRACTLQAKSTNTVIIYLGFSSAVTTTRWFKELQPGQSITIDDYRGPIFAIATAANQKLGWGVW